MKDKTIKKIYFRIGEVAEMFHVEPSTIRFWLTTELAQFIGPIKRNNQGQRRFIQSNIDSIKQICHFRFEAGYTVEGTITVMKLMIASVERLGEVECSTCMDRGWIYHPYVGSRIMCDCSKEKDVIDESKCFPKITGIMIHKK